MLLRFYLAAILFLMSSHAKNFDLRDIILKYDLIIWAYEGDGFRQCWTKLILLKI